MSQIIINEISNNFTYSIGNNSYATVALPITSSWGPGFFDPEMVVSDEEADTLEDKVELELEGVVWQHFDSTQDGIEKFKSTYRGPASNYRLASDMSFYEVITLLTAGYAVDVCRLCPGNVASSPSVTIKDESGDVVSTATLTLKAKYPGTFGNNLICALYKPVNRNYWNLITYVKDSSGVKSSVENIAFVFDPNNSTDSIPYVDEVESSFVDIVHTGDIYDTYSFSVNEIDTKSGVSLSGGTDRRADVSGETVEDVIVKAKELAVKRFYKMRTADSVTVDDVEAYSYIQQLDTDAGNMTDMVAAQNIEYKEWLYRYVLDVYDLLKDKLAYNPNRIISPGWDDIDVTSIGGVFTSNAADATVMECISPIHLKLMEVAYYSRCATAYLDIPKCLPRKDVYDESDRHMGYAQMLATYEPENDSFDVNGPLYTSHSALFAPWSQYKYVGTSKYSTAAPSMLTLLIQRSMVLNQSLQYEWIMPTNRTHSINITKPDYTIPRKVLQEWQPTDEEGGTTVNVITDIPGMGYCLWGNGTLFNNPPATYNALRNLSTRHLVCALENVIYKAGISITFRYNNQEAYSAFYAGVTPLLDTMVNCGALERYYVTMANDIDALGMIKANSIIGKVYIVPVGCIEKITVDLIALPPGTDLTAYM